MSYDTLEHYYKDVLKYVDLSLAAYYEATTSGKEETLLGWQIKHKSEATEAYLEKGTKQLESIRMKVSKTLSTSVFLPLEYLIETFKLNLFEVFCLYLSISVELDPSFEKNIRYFNESIDSPYPSLGLALKIYAKDVDEYLDLRCKINEESRLVKYFYMESFASQKQQPFIGVLLRLDSSIVQFVLHASDYQPSQDFMRLVSPLMPRPTERFIEKTIEEKLETFVTENYDNHLNKNVLIHLWGPEGVGKASEVTAFCRHFEQSAIYVDCKRLSINAFNDLELRQISREAIMHRAILVFEHFEYLSRLLEDPSVGLYVERLFLKISEFAKVCFVLSTVAWNPRLNCQPFSVLDWHLPLPNGQERLNLWQEKSAHLALAPEVNLQDLANKFVMSPKQINQALQDATNTQIWENSQFIDAPALHKASYLQMSHQLGERAQLLKGNHTWKDLVLPNEQVQSLKQATNQVKFKHKVFGDWHFKEKLNYGTGLGLLFTGPPGTGKTMAAGVIANALNLEIYRVDLSQVISKYIGETEKNLKLIFDEAALSSAILLFDEGDALFSKRTEVGDSHDKYANVETSYLLQKIESYEGMCIVTTNLIGNVDEAFIRRFSYVIHFPLPTPEYRRQIWRQIFPKQVPLSKTLDFEYLGDRFELSGGSIKNIALNSAFLAASEYREVTMKDLLLCVSAELSKSGKTILPSDFGQYAYLLNPSVF